MGQEAHYHHTLPTSTAAAATAPARGVDGKVGRRAGLGRAARLAPSACLGRGRGRRSSSLRCRPHHHGVRLPPPPPPKHPRPPPPGPPAPGTRRPLPPRGEIKAAIGQTAAAATHEQGRGWSTVSTAITCSRGAAHSGRHRRRIAKLKTIAFPPKPVRHLPSISLRRLLPRPRPLTVVVPGGGGWFRLGRRRKTPAEDLAAVALSLALAGDRLTALAEAWNASGLGQALGILAVVLGRGRRTRGSRFRRLVAFLLGVTFCALICHLRGAALLDGLQKSGGGWRLLRIFLVFLSSCSSA
ncbi:hypothetical protein SEVIR_8G161566v4 [Setaria viridis]|uniref:uncharacterized protein n=1 Tax=Setaria viridis TaxID=4556 RepID=UPI003B3B6FB5